MDNVFVHSLSVLLATYARGRRQIHLCIFAFLPFSLISEYAGKEVNKNEAY